MALKEFFKGLKRGQKTYGENLQTIVNSVLLSVVYFIGMGITSIISKVFRKKFLKLKIERSQESYWEDLNLEKKPLEEYYRQF